MTTPTTPMRGDAAVAGYVAAVRARLGDLTGEEIEELTGGLEADLAEALYGSGASPYDMFGDHAVYAEELRAAAGLPPRARPTAWAAVEARGRALTAHPAWPQVRDFMMVLRPVWWVLRAWVLWRSGLDFAADVAGFFPGGVLGFAVLLFFIVLSVELGRRAPYPTQALATMVLIGNLLLILALPFALDASNRTEEYLTGMSAPTPGLARDGEPIYNVFPFDAQGNPLRDVRLYDERGRSLSTGEQTYVDGEGREWRLVPRAGLSREQSWNMYPLQRQQLYDDFGQPLESASEDAPAPFPAVPPLLAAPAPVQPTPVQPTPAQSASAQPTPSVTPSADPSATAATTPTEAPSATVGP